jgi:hypothetical protein
MLKIVDVDYLGEYKLRLLFSNRAEGVVDLEKTLEAPAYKNLKDEHLFIQFALLDGVIEWVTGVDLAPEYLLGLIKNERRAA